MAVVGVDPDGERTLALVLGGARASAEAFSPQHVLVALNFSVMAGRVDSSSLVPRA